jgi:hypothetical protein
MNKMRFDGFDFRYKKKKEEEVYRSYFVIMASQI